MGRSSCENGAFLSVTVVVQSSLFLLLSSCPAAVFGIDGPMHSKPNAAEPECVLSSMSQWHPQLCLNDGDRANGTVLLSCAADSLDLTHAGLLDWLARFTRGRGVFSQFSLSRCALPRTMPAFCATQLLVSEQVFWFWPNVNVAPNTCPGMPLRRLSLLYVVLEQIDSWRSWLLTYRASGGYIDPDFNDTLELRTSPNLAVGLREYLTLFSPPASTKAIAVRRAGQPFNLRIASTEGLQGVLDALESADITPLSQTRFLRLELPSLGLRRLPRSLRAGGVRELSLILNGLTRIRRGDLERFGFDNSPVGPGAGAVLDLTFNVGLCYVELGAFADILERNGTVRLLATEVQSREGLKLLGINASRASDITARDLKIIGLLRYRHLALECCCEDWVGRPCRLHDLRDGPIAPCAQATGTTLSRHTTLQPRPDLKSSPLPAAGEGKTYGVGWLALAAIAGCLCSLVLSAIIYGAIVATRRLKRVGPATPIPDLPDPPPPPPNAPSVPSSSREPLTVASPLEKPAGDSVNQPSSYNKSSIGENGIEQVATASEASDNLNLSITNVESTDNGPNGNDKKRTLVASSTHQVSQNFEDS